MSPGHRKLPPTLATSCTSRVQAGFGSFPYQLTFKFGESREETKYQLTAGAGRIDVCALAGKDFKKPTPLADRSWTVLTEADQATSLTFVA